MLKNSRPLGWPEPCRINMFDRGIVAWRMSETDIVESNQDGAP
jgi:hypothetical protein